MKERNFTRRDFLKTGAMAAAASAVYMNSPMKLFGMDESKTRVVLIRNNNVVDATGKVNATIMQQMLDEAVKVLFDIRLEENHQTKRRCGN